MHAYGGKHLNSQHMTFIKRRTRLKQIKHTYKKFPPFPKRQKKIKKKKTNKHRNVALFGIDASHSDTKLHTMCNLENLAVLYCKPTPPHFFTHPSLYRKQESFLRERYNHMKQHNILIIG
mmetsp:Transcript_7973/g.8741  ORF Transcript_7973/g.8741 Transcript_7973/m.8741 type:complete len:120 (+) Transcript_7973:189-548(+)